MEVLTNCEVHGKNVPRVMVDPVLLRFDCAYCCKEREEDDQLSASRVTEEEAYR